MKYRTIDELDARIERIADKTIQHYYTDWKNYDRPYYMKLKGSTRREDKDILWIARESGSYLYTLDELKSYEHGRVVCEYEWIGTRYFRINLESLTIKELKYDDVQKILRDLEKYGMAA